VNGAPPVVASDPLDRPPGGLPGPWLDRLLARCRFPDPADDSCTLAVSGGPDSMALMVLARQAGLRGVVIHVDHGLRPGSSAEGAVVERAARPLGFDFRTERVAVPDGPDLEARARRARYAVLPPGVMTGHTMDDQAETVLLNLIRGAGLDGLAGMRSSSRIGSTSSGSHQVVRPLLGIRRSETAEVCRRAGLTPVADPSNSDLRFRRNRVRAELVPLMTRIADRDVVPVLARQASLMAADAGFLDDQAAHLDPTDARALREAPAPLARRALRAWLRSGPGFHPPSSAELGRVMDVVHGRATACELSGGRRVARSRGRLSVSPAPAPCPPQRTPAPDTRGKGPR
jgi:tRNA(Ile)-lysidine synthase